MKATSALQHLLLLLRSNWITRAGAWMTTLSFTVMISLFVLQALGTIGGPYSGLATFLILPTFFVIGLALIPAGLFIFRRRLGERIEVVRKQPRQLLKALAVLTLVNVVVVGVAGYHGFHYMDSVEFCGTVCHEVMQPEYEAYMRSPHARVGCVECHIGPGASWFVKAKLSGARQVLAVLGDTYPRPIPTPIANLRPARETCERCHWPDRFLSDKLVIRQHFKRDRESTPYTNVLVLKTGGARPDGRVTGIHWHVHQGNEVTYRATDHDRMDIPWVKLVNHQTGEEEIFTARGTDPAAPPAGEDRTMDCLDCHNRPSHIYERAHVALNDAIASGLVSRRLPFVKKVGYEILRRDWEDRDATEGMRAALMTYYTETEPVAEDLLPAVEAAAVELGRIRARNVYPSMGIDWDTYRSHAGHYGCLRCHDDEHVSASGRVISMDCETCHATLAFQRRDPEILRQLSDD